MRNQKLWKQAIALSICAMMAFSTPMQALCAQGVVVENTELSEEETKQTTEASDETETETTETTEAAETTETAETTEAAETTEMPEITDTEETTEILETTETIEMEAAEEMEVTEETLKADGEEVQESVVIGGVEYRYNVEDKAYSARADEQNPTEITEILGEINGIPVTRIEENGFAMCNNDMFGNVKGTLKIHSNIKEIGKSAFSDCYNMTGIELPEGLVEIGSEAFCGCTGLKGTLTLPKGLKKIGDAAFGASDSVQYNLLNSTILWEKGCTGLTGVEFQEGVEEIGDYAFHGCTGLKGTLKLPDGLKKIGKFAFVGCTGLTGVDFPKGMEKIKEFAFAECKNIKKVQFSEGLKKIGRLAFWKCNKITKVNLPKGLEEIEYGAFCGCSGITDVTFPDSLKKIEGNILGTSTKFYAGAFANCTGIKNITLPKNLEELGDATFYGCTALKSVTVKSGRIGVSAFSGCSALEKVTLKEGVTTIGNTAFYDSTKLQSIKIPASVNQIGTYAFMGCTKLAKVTLQEGLSEIGEAAFANCTIKEITMPESVTKIAEGVFPYGIQKVYCYKDSAAYKYVKKYKEKYGYSISFIKDSKKKVSFNANGGKNLSMNAKRIASGKTLGKLPTAEKKGYVLKGWYTKKSGGTKFTAKTKIKKNQTLYAQWTKVKKPGKITEAAFVYGDNGLPTMVQFAAISGVDGYEVTGEFESSSGSYGSSCHYKEEIQGNLFDLEDYAWADIRDELEEITLTFKVRAYKLDSAGKKIYGPYSDEISITKVLKDDEED